MHARVPQVMAQLVLKIEKLSQGTALIVELARLRSPSLIKAPVPACSISMMPEENYTLRQYIATDT